MPITLDDFKKGGYLYKYVTKVGLIDKIGNPDFDQDLLLKLLIESITHTGLLLIKHQDDEENDILHGDPNDPSFPDIISIKSGKKPSNSNLSKNSYYINIDNLGVTGNIYIKEGKSIDMNSIYVFDESSNSWKRFISVNDCFIDTNTTITHDGITYQVWKFGFYDEDYSKWLPTMRNISFELK